MSVTDPHVRRPGAAHAIQAHAAAAIAARANECAARGETPAGGRRARAGRAAHLGLAGAAVLLALTGCGKPSPATAAAAGGSAAAAVPAAAGRVEGRAAFDQAATGTGFAVGQPMAARTVQVFFDPQCPHCGALWRASQPLLDRVRMVWMPVAFVSPRSLPQGAWLLAAADPRAAMNRHEEQRSAGQGGIAGDGEPPAERLKQVRANTELLTKMGYDSVPTMMYRVGNEGPWGVVPGGMSTEDLARLLGL